MIEHEISELESKWQDYRNRRKTLLNKETPKGRKKFFVTLFILLILGAVLFAIYSENELVKEQKSRLINLVNTFKKSNEIEVNPVELSKENPIRKREEVEDEYLNLNDLEVMISEDGAGFERITRRKEEATPAPVQNQNNPTSVKEIVYMPTAYPMAMPVPAQQQIPSNNYAPTENQEIISFQGYPDSPSGKKNTTQAKTTSKAPNKLQIQTKKSNASAIDKMIEVFNKSKNPNYAIMLSDEYYAQKKYAEAEKWALTANDLNKDDARSWIAFAKAKYQQGAKNIAIDILRNYNSRMPNDAVSTLLRDMEAGAF